MTMRSHQLRRNKDRQFHTALQERRAQVRGLAETPKPAKAKAKKGGKKK